MPFAMPCLFWCLICFGHRPLTSKVFCSILTLGIIQWGRNTSGKCARAHKTPAFWAYLHLHILRWALHDLEDECTAATACLSIILRRLLRQACSFCRAAEVEHAGACWCFLICVTIWSNEASVVLSKSRQSLNGSSSSSWIGRPRWGERSSNSTQKATCVTCVTCQTGSSIGFVQTLEFFTA